MNFNKDHPLNELVKLLQLDTAAVPQGSPAKRNINRQRAPWDVTESLFTVSSSYYFPILLKHQHSPAQRFDGDNKRRYLRYMEPHQVLRQVEPGGFFV